MLPLRRFSIPALVKILLLSLFLLLPASAPPQPRLGPARVVITHNPKIGVHTRLTDVVEEWKIRKTLEMVREMGASYIVEYFPWAYLEPAPGRYSWAHSDLVVDHARNQGLTVIARLDLVPSWARPGQTTARYLERSSFPLYGRFVAAFLRHFQGRVHHIVVWNEPHTSFEGGFRPPDALAYAELLKVAYRAAKEVDPECLVLAAGLAPTLAEEGNPWAVNDLLFLDRLYQAGAREHFDALAVHAYGHRSPPDEVASSQRLNFARVELVHELMAQYGDGDKKIFITEGGWNDHPRWVQAVRPHQRIEYTVDAYQKALAEWDWCQAVCLWAFRAPRPTHTFHDYFTFVSSDFTPKPIYLAVRQYSQLAPERKQDLP